MQRKNSFLKISAGKNRAGMAIIMAIAVIVILATIMALSLSLTTQTAKRTTDIYLYEQAALASKSVAERTLLSIAENTCNIPNADLNYRLDLNGNGTTTDDIYDINITLRFVYTGTVIGCTDYFNINTPEQNGSVLMDIAVSTDIGSEPIRYFRRTIQKL